MLAHTKRQNKRFLALKLSVETSTNPVTSDWGGDLEPPQVVKFRCPWSEKSSKIFENSERSAEGSVTVSMRCERRDVAPVSGPKVTLDSVNVSVHTFDADSHFFVTSGD